MGRRVDGYRAELRGLKRWEPYLKKHSGLPGPRANLELVQAVGDEADSDRLWRFSASADEFLALCGTAGLGKVALMEPDTVMTWLRELAADRRWRVREGVAMALQRIERTRARCRCWRSWIASPSRFPQRPIGRMTTSRSCGRRSATAGASRPPQPRTTRSPISRSGCARRTGTWPGS